jgi:hypothetical protein
MAHADDINYTKEALFSTWNLVFLAVGLVTAVGLAVGLGLNFGLLALVLFGAEAGLLFALSRNERFQRVVRSEKRARRHRPPSQKQRFEALPMRDRKRYTRLRKLRDEIEANHQRLSEAASGLVDTYVQKLDDLLDRYLTLLYRRKKYRDQLDSAEENKVRKSIEALERDMADDAERVREVKAKRLRLLKQRLERFNMAHENLEIISARLVTIEDNVKHLHEASWTMQPPEEASAQIDRLLDEIEQSHATVREVQATLSGTDDPILSEDEEMERLDAELEASLRAKEEQASSSEGASSSGPSSRRVRG